MSPSSTADSPQSATAAHPFPLSTRDSFSVDIPSPQLANGALKSPTSAAAQRGGGFGRDGILGPAEKTRNMSQSSDGKPDTNGCSTRPATTASTRSSGATRMPASTTRAGAPPSLYVSGAGAGAGARPARPGAARWPAARGA